VKKEIDKSLKRQHAHLIAKPIALHYNGLVDAWELTGRDMSELIKWMHNNDGGGHISVDDVADWIEMEMDKV